MQRTCTAEDSMQSRSSISTQKVSHSGGGGGHGWGRHAPHLTIFFELPPQNQYRRPMGHSTPPLPQLEALPHLKNKPPSMKRETTFQNDSLEKTQ